MSSPPFEAPAMALPGIIYLASPDRIFYLSSIITGDFFTRHCCGGQGCGHRLRRPLQRRLAAGAAGGAISPPRLAQPPSPAEKPRRMIHPDVRSRFDHPAVLTCYSAG